MFSVLDTIGRAYVNNLKFWNLNLATNFVRGQTKYYVNYLSDHISPPNGVNYGTYDKVYIV